MSCLVLDCLDDSRAGCEWINGLQSNNKLEHCNDGDSHLLVASAILCAESLRDNFAGHVHVAPFLLLIHFTNC